MHVHIFVSIHEKCVFLSKCMYLYMHHCMYVCMYVYKYVVISHFLALCAVINHFWISIGVVKHFLGSICMKPYMVTSSQASSPKGPYISVYLHTCMDVGLKVPSYIFPAWLYATPLSTTTSISHQCHTSTFPTITCKLHHFLHFSYQHPLPTPISILTMCSYCISQPSPNSTLYPKCHLYPLCNDSNFAYT